MYSRTAVIKLFGDGFHRGIKQYKIVQQVQRQHCIAAVIVLPVYLYHAVELPSWCIFKFHVHEVGIQAMKLIHKDVVVRRRRRLGHKYPNRNIR